MIDLHAHILPGQDDGPQALEESLEMLRIAAGSGTTDIVATSHANHRFSFHAAIVRHKLAELRDAAGLLPRIHYGCELHLTPENIAAAYRSPGDYCMAGANSLLIEVPDLQIPPNIEEILRLLVAADIRPVIAHPERVPALQKQHRQLMQWIALGCAVQITAQSIAGDFGAAARVAADDFLRRGIVHAVASDGHDIRDRLPVLKPARKYVEDRFGKNTARLLFEENPAAILSGRALQSVAKRRWWALR